MTTENEVREWVSELLRAGATRRQVRVLAKNRVDVALHEERWSEVAAVSQVLNSEVFA